MSSFLLFSASITLVLLSILPLSTAAYIVDVDGDPLLDGAKYYIVQITNTTSTSGLTHPKREGMSTLHYQRKN
ncbi:hypothetical protein RND81_01G140100 [Saponaria officinalis]|uniref:Uncharacterized protein n=1 Tax=Saponaria officinalis TaxID=3572 RepID=A0AAW1N9V7_SAPOF